MPLLSGTAELQCRHCDYSFYIDAFELAVEQVGADERQMGLEIFYEGAVELHCAKCRGYIKMNYEASEYPTGVLNYSETHIEGARIIQGFKDIDVVGQDEIYSFEEESRLFLPEEKKIITSLGSCVDELIREITKAPSLLYQISPRQFEQLIAHIFSENKFTVDLTRKTRDGGIDIIACKSDLGIKSKFIIECKRYAANKPVGVGLVRALYGVHMAEGANKSVLATTSRFTRPALEFAKTANTTEWAMDLKDFDDICEWIKSAGTKSELIT